jgi:Zn-dependent protease
VIDFTLSQLVMRLAAALLASTLQGFAIAAAAVALGDPGPRSDGRRTINPLAHVDLIGGAMALIFAAGWAKWVAIDPRALRHGHLDLLLVVAAGFLAIVAGVEVLRWGRPFLLPLLPDTAAAASFALIQTTIEVALAFALFSLLPVPPLAGGHLLLAVAPGLRDRWPRLPLVLGLILAAAMFTGAVSHVLDPAVRLLVAFVLGEDVGM